MYGAHGDFLLVFVDVVEHSTGSNAQFPDGRIRFPCGRQVDEDLPVLRRHGRLVRHLGFDRVQDPSPVVDAGSLQVVLHTGGESEHTRIYRCICKHAHSTPREGQRAGARA